MAACDVFIPAGAQLDGVAPDSCSASGQIEGSVSTGTEAPPSPEPIAYTMAMLPKDARWHDWADQETSDDVTDYGCMTSQWSTSNGSDGSWPSPQRPSVGDGSWPLPQVAAGNGADWRPMMMGRGSPTAAPRPKRRFCSSYPDVGACRRGSACAYAHSREEICANLLDMEEENQHSAAMTDEFFMYKYKTRWCPKGVQHEWHTCVYAHNYQDARRPVSIGYGVRLCPYWSKKDTGAEYAQRCPLGLRCPYAHGAKEQLYHPHYFKTIVCRDLRGNGCGGGKACPRHMLCAFFHNKAEKRLTPTDDVDYSQPLSAEALDSAWIEDFLTPPFLPEGNKAGGYEDCNLNGSNEMMPYMVMGDGECVPSMQTPCLVFVPVRCMMPSMQGDGDMTNSPNGATGMTPTGGVSPCGGQPLAQNWVFVPMDGGCSPSNGAMN